MKRPFFVLGVSVLTLGSLFGADTNPRSVPIYSVNVVSRTTKAISYQHLSGPTKVDLKGTVLLPDLKGEATVDPRRGNLTVDAKLKKLPDPSRFGAQYLTYVLWAVTPDGRATNLGELIGNHSDKANLMATTQFQTFGLIVTAEPYYSVTRPSNVVVAENAIRPDTIGGVQEIQAKTELLDRGQYTFDVTAAKQADNANRRKVGKDEYEALLNLYQARNSVQLAKVNGVPEAAPDVFQRAETLLQQAEDAYATRKDYKRVVTISREAIQTAQDARMMAASKRGENPGSIDAPSMAQSNTSAQQ